MQNRACRFCVETVFEPSVLYFLAFEYTNGTLKYIDYSALYINEYEPPVEVRNKVFHNVTNERSVLVDYRLPVLYTYFYLDDNYQIIEVDREALDNYKKI